MQNQLKILVLSSGRFSGATDSLVHSLENSGCKVLTAKASLRNLHYRVPCICLLISNALIVYGTRFRKYINRTSAFYACMSKSNEELVRKHDNVDVIVQIGANFNSYWKNKNRSVLYTILTDHTNLLSKKTAHNLYRGPEFYVKSHWNIIERQIFKAQDHTFVMGSHVKRSIVNDYRIDANKVSVVGAGPNLDLDIERDGIQKNFNRRKILFVGIDSQRKGLDLLVRAFDEIVEKFPDARLNIAGVEGTNTSHITYHGLIKGDALKQLFYDAQIFALPTYREPFGFVLIEAMFAKCACIGTVTGAIPDIIEDRKSGFLIDVGDVQALKERIIYLFSNPTVLKKMAEMGFYNARNKWTWNLVAEKMIQRMNSLIAVKEVSLSIKKSARSCQSDSTGRF